MIRSALCLSGRPYGLIECSNSIIKNIIEPNNCDVFIHAWHNEELEGQRYRQHSQFPGLVPKDCVNKIKDIYKPKGLTVERQREFSTADFDSVYQPGDKYFIFAIQSMLYSIQKSNEIKKLYEKDNNIKYDYVCRSRFDMVYDNVIEFAHLDNESIWIYNDCKHETGCMNDHFAVSISYNMDIYSDLYDQIYSMYKDGCPWCNEVFLGRWIQKNGISVKHLDISYKQYK